MPDGRQVRRLLAGGARSTIEGMKMALAQRGIGFASIGRARGFTLVELMTSVAVLAVLLVVAAPNLAGFLRSSKVRSAQSELVSSLMLARSEAAKRGATVGVVATAGSVGNEFGGGWKVWIDDNANGAVDVGEVVIRDYPGFSGAVVLGKTAGVLPVAFAPTGFAADAVTFKVCGASDTAKGYQVALQRVGLADVTEGVACP